MAAGTLTRGERVVLAVATIAAALSRFAAISRTPWDWDEVQFLSALQAFDVTLHHPHPPGFPLFIAAAKLLTLAGLSPFRALQAVSVMASMAIVPAMFFLAREAKATFVVALHSALLLAFFPNLWFYGGTAFSDVPAMVLVVLAVALLLRGSRSDASFLGGAIVLALAAGFRPQNLAIGAVPFVIAAFQRRRAATIAAAALIVIAIVGVSYGVAVQLSGGWTPFRETLAGHQQYITHVDSFLNPNRPALWRLFDDFFVRPYRAPVINAVVTLFVAIGLWLAVTARRTGALIVLASFGPFCIFAWLFLDHFSASRFSIGYAPLMAMLAAEGIGAIGAPRISSAIAAFLVAMMAIWTLPALVAVRSTLSPPMSAIEFLRAHYSPSSCVVDVQRPMEAFADELLPEYSRQLVDAAVIRLVKFGSTRAEVLLCEGAPETPDAMTFSRPRKRLWWLARQRYFDVTVAPLQRPAFGADWYGEESDGIRVWRWTARLGTIAIPASIHPSVLTLRIHRNEGAGVAIFMDGAPIDRIVAGQPDFVRTYDIAPRDRVAELAIETDRVVNPARAGISSDPRDLGIRLDSFELKFDLEPEWHPGLHALPGLHRR